MAKTLVKNITVEAVITLPPPYNRIMKPGTQVVIGDFPATVAANLGGASVFKSALDVSDASSTGLAVDIQPYGSKDFAVVQSIIDAPAKSANSIVAATAANAANALVVAANPDIPRNLRVIFAASWDGGDVTVLGTDQFGNAQSETFTTGSGVTRTGSKIFKTVTSASKATVGATANTVTVGTGDKLGLSIPLSDAAANYVGLTDGAIEAFTVDPTVSGFTPTTVPNGAHDYLVIGNV